MEDPAEAAEAAEETVPGFFWKYIL